MTRFARSGHRAARSGRPPGTGAERVCLVGLATVGQRGPVGPPVWSPASLAMVDEAMNTAEFSVHHEDVLRGGQSWSGRELSTGLESALWRIVSTVARLHFARSPVGVVLVAPSHGRQQVHTMTDLGTVIVTGTPGELLLYSFGRRSVAQVDLSGAQEALIAI